MTTTPLRIELRGLRVFAHHGVLEREQRDGQTFVIDLELIPVDAGACDTDVLSDAVDYSQVAARVVALVTGSRHDLIERLAAAIADDLLATYPIAWVSARVAKPEVPMPHPLTEVAVVVEREAALPQPRPGV